MATDLSGAPERGLINCPHTHRVFVRGVQYSPTFVSGAKAIGGRWRGHATGWIFTADRAVEARKLFTRVYGIPKGCGVTVHAHAKRRITSLDLETVKLGRHVVMAWVKELNGSRLALPRYGLRIGPGVTCLSGGVVDAHSTLAIAAGSEFIIEDADPALLLHDQDPWAVTLHIPAAEAAPVVPEPATETPQR